MKHSQNFGILLIWVWKTAYLGLARRATSWRWRRVKKKIGKRPSKTHKCSVLEKGDKVIRHSTSLFHFYILTWWKSNSRIRRIHSKLHFKIPWCLFFSQRNNLVKKIQGRMFSVAGMRFFSPPNKRKLVSPFTRVVLKFWNYAKTKHPYSENLPSFSSVNVWYVDRTFATMQNKINEQENTNGRLRSTVHKKRSS